MEWSDKFCLGVERIDQQHKELFRAVNRIVRIVDEGDMVRNQRVCVEAIKYLKNYTIMHFEDEEAYQREIGYGGCEQHKQLHDAFRAVILKREEILQSNSYSQDSVLDFVEILTAWLVEHIMKDDQAIVHGSQEKASGSV